MVDLYATARLVCRVGAVVFGPAASADADAYRRVVTVELPGPDELTMMLARPRPVVWVQPGLFEVS